jgi:hypothetical protein
VVDHLEAIRMAPKAPEAHDNFARYWIVCPEQRNGAMAIELATRACELCHWEDWKCLNTLSAAQAIAGDDAAAGGWAAKALEAAPDQDKSSCRADLAELTRLGAGRAVADEPN